jgi:hypothetical protein
VHGDKAVFTVVAAILVGGAVACALIIRRKNGSPSYP